MSTDSTTLFQAQTVDDLTAPRLPFWDDRWKMRWVYIGLFCFALLHLSSHLDRSWFDRLPAWLTLGIGLFLPQLLFLIYPLLTRKRATRVPLKLPGLVNLIIEGAIAVPIVGAIIVSLMIVGTLLQKYAPGTSLTPDAMKRLAESPGDIRLYIFAITAFTLPPLCEEVFFRGFIFNAFRTRSPWLLAAVVESLIFGFGHTFGWMHAIFASILGLILTLVYVWRKTLLTGMFVHCGVNLFGVLGLLAMTYLNAHSPMVGFTPKADQKGVVIDSILPDSPAEKAGLQPGDEIDSFDGLPIRDFMQFKQQLWQRKAGQKVRLGIKRDGQQIEVEVELRRRPPES